jgi:dihydroorotase
VDATALVSRSRNTPFAGTELTARPVATFLRGRLTARDGAVVA